MPNKPKQIPTALANAAGDHRSREQYEKYYFTPACKFIRKATTNLASQRIQQSMEKTDTRSQLELPSYSEKQAFESGYRAAMREIQGLLDR